MTRLTSHFREHDMHDVYQIIMINKDDATKVDSTVDMLSNYATLSTKLVAASNQWRRRYLDMHAQPWIEHNMTLSFECLHNNCTGNLHGKAMDLYSTYKPAEQGGPLFLMIILQLIQTNTEARCMHLQATLRKLTLTDLPGEDVPKMATLLRGIHDHLEQAKSPSFVEWRRASHICSYRSYATVVDYLPG